MLAVMALEGGNPECTTGFSKVFFDAFGIQPEPIETYVTRLCAAMGEGMAEYIIANAETHTEISTGGLQSYDPTLTSVQPTGAPSLPVMLVGTIS